MEKFVKTLKTEVIPALETVWVILKGIISAAKAIGKVFGFGARIIDVVANVLTFGKSERFFDQLTAASVAGIGKGIVGLRDPNRQAATIGEIFNKPTEIKSPEAAMSQSRVETVNRGELTIRDETGRAELTGDEFWDSVKLLPSGAFE